MIRRAEDRPPFDRSKAGCSIPTMLQRVNPKWAAVCRIYHEGCCDHDEDYHFGIDGDEESHQEADEKLFTYCLSRVGVRDPANPETGYAATEEDAHLVYWGVRLGGKANWGTGAAFDGRRNWAEVTQSP